MKTFLIHLWLSWIKVCFKLSPLYDLVFPKKYVTPVCVMPGESKDMLVLLLTCILFITQSDKMYHFNTSRVMLFNATFNNISVISWRSVLLVEETRVPGENHRPVANHRQTLSHNVSGTPYLREIRTHNFSGDRH